MGWAETDAQSKKSSLKRPAPVLQHRSDRVTSKCGGIGSTCYMLPGCIYLAPSRNSITRAP